MEKPLQDKILEVYNCSFKHFESSPAECLRDICQPTILKELLLEAIPTIVADTDLEFELEDNNGYDSKYSNMNTVLLVLDKYCETRGFEDVLEENSISGLKVNELISDQPFNSEQIKLLEIIFLIFSYLLDEIKIDIEDQFEFIEMLLAKYDKSNDNGNREPKRSVFRTMTRSTTIDVVTTNKILEEKNHIIEVLKLENEDLKKKVESFESRENIMKSKEEVIQRYDDDLHRFQEEQNQLRITISNKENEVDELKHIININSKKYLEDIEKLKERCDSLANLENELKNTAKINDNYKQKIKELMVYKTKAEDQENLKQVIDAVMTENELYKKEKQLNIHKIDVLSNTIASHIEKIKSLEIERNKLMAELEEANKEVYKMEKIKKRGYKNVSSMRPSTVLNNALGTGDLDETYNKNLLDDTSNNNINLDQIEEFNTAEEQDNNNNIEQEWERERSRMKKERDLEIENTQLKRERETSENKIFDLKNEIFELKSDLNELSKSLKEKNAEIERYRVLQLDVEDKVDDKAIKEGNEEKEKNIVSSNLEQIIILESNIKQLNEEKRGVLIEKNKLEIELSKTKIDNERGRMEMDAELIKLEAEKNELKIRYEDEIKEKKQLSKELEEARNLMTSNASLVNKMLDEKLEIVGSEQQTREASDSLKIKLESDFKEKLSRLEHEISTNQGLLKRSVELEYKLEVTLKEMKVLDDKLRAKDNKIKGLEDQIIKKEERIKNLIAQIKENNDVYYQTLERKHRDISYYKKLVEEQQIQFTKENDLILNKLFELSLQFNALKCDWDKKVELDDKQVM